MFVQAWHWWYFKSEKVTGGGGVLKRGSFLLFLSGSLLVRVLAWHTVSFFSGSCFVFFFSRRACFCWHVYLPQQGCQMDLSLSPVWSLSLSFSFLFFFSLFFFLWCVGWYSVSSCLNVLEGENCEKYPDSPPLVRGNFCSTAGISSLPATFCGRTQELNSNKLSLAFNVHFSS